MRCTLLRFFLSLSPPSTHPAAPSHASTMADQKQIPVTMLSGFLGAGEECVGGRPSASVFPWGDGHAPTPPSRLRRPCTNRAECGQGRGGRGGRGPKRPAGAGAGTPADPPRSPPPPTGKTTLLRHLLQNSTLKIGCVVNDVADVNIDAKLVRNDRSRARGGGGDAGGDGAPAGPSTTSDLADTVELANGCACEWMREKGGGGQEGAESSFRVRVVNPPPFPPPPFFSPGCSIQDELFGSFEQLLTLADKKGSTYDR